MLSLFGITTVVLLYAIDVDSIIKSGFWISIAYSVSTILICFNMWLGIGTSCALTEILVSFTLKIKKAWLSTSGKIDLNIIINHKTYEFFNDWIKIINYWSLAIKVMCIEVSESYASIQLVLFKFAISTFA